MTMENMGQSEFYSINEACEYLNSQTGRPFSVGVVEKLTMQKELNLEVFLFQSFSGGICHVNNGIGFSKIFDDDYLNPLPKNLVVEAIRCHFTLPRGIYKISVYDWTVEFDKRRYCLEINDKVELTYENLSTEKPLNQIINPMYVRNNPVDSKYFNKVPNDSIYGEIGYTRAELDRYINANKPNTTHEKVKREWVKLVREKAIKLWENNPEITQIKQLETPLMEWIKEKGIVSDRNQPLAWETVQRHTTQNLPKKRKK